MYPIIGQAYEGRANPKGIPYLYLANDKETALAEVRPWLGSLISISEFKVARKIKVIDCSINHNLKLSYYVDEPVPNKREKIIWTQIDKAFSEPVQLNDDSADYVPTQIIAKFFKINKFDGIMYQSNLGVGQNIVLFNTSSATIISRAVYKSTKIKFEFEEVSSPKKRVIRLDL